MRKVFLVVFGLLSLGVMKAPAQELTSNDPFIDNAFQLAIRTVDINIRRDILAAGADYGSEWTRDISINVWNGVGLLRPRVAEMSMWSVTIGMDTVGQQYWDKILWVISAYHLYLVSGDRIFLRHAYACSAHTMASLERYAFDDRFGLFMGPSVFNDGIAAYPEPIYDPNNYSSFVLDHHGTRRIKCLSTNCVYYGAYQALAKMAGFLNMDTAVSKAYEKKATDLKRAILAHFYDPSDNRFAYLIDQYDHLFKAQEALGLSFAVMFGVVDGLKAQAIINQAVVSPFGITSIHPPLPRFTLEKPGRHNDMIWPMVNGFFAQAAIDAGDTASFKQELYSLVRLALDEDKGNYDFREIYNAGTGKPDGGWQTNGPEHPRYHWESCKLQTWSATAYISMILHGVLGLRFNEGGLSFAPFLPVSPYVQRGSVNYLEITDLPYREAILDIRLEGHGRVIKSFFVDGKPRPDHAIDGSLKGRHRIVIELE